jgi:acyl-CoA thioesterase-1
MEELLDRMEKCGARIVWASTTPIPDDPAKGQKSVSIVERNAVAAQIMKRRGHGTDDLFLKVSPCLETYQNPKDVHFNAAGYDFLGAQVAESIRAELKPASAAPAAQKSTPVKN